MQSGGFLPHFFCTSAYSDESESSSWVAETVALPDPSLLTSTVTSIVKNFLLDTDQIQAVFAYLDDCAV